MLHGRLRSILVALSLCGWSGAAWAEESLIGLPAPRDPNRPGAVVLHGGGRITEDVFERFVQLAGGQQARILLVPSAGYRAKDHDSREEFLAAMKSRFSAWVSLASAGHIRSFEFLYTDDPDDADDADFVKPLATATGVWFCGGAQERLNYRFVGEFPARSKFQEALRQVLARGGVVGGTSAGMAALPEIMTMWQDREYSDAPATAVAAHGLALFNQAIVEQHFDARGGRLERFTGLLRDADRLDQLAERKGAGAHMVGLAVEESTGLIVRGNRLEVLGNGNVHVFLKSHAGRTMTWHELVPGDTAQLRRDVPGAAALRREEVMMSQ